MSTVLLDNGGHADVQRHWLRLQRRAMACAFEITLDARDAADVTAAQAALNQVEQLESQLSVFRDTSAISDINRRAAIEAVSCDAALFELLLHCASLSVATDKAFDITSTPLSRCWGFLKREGRVPSDVEIAQARGVVGMSHVFLDEHRRAVRFEKQGVELNLGAIGKGYALDCIAGSLRRDGVDHALLSAGQSSLLAIGGRDRGWSVDVVSPRRDRALARIWLRDAALGTSGAGTQFVVIEGTRYGHVIDPRSGRPAAGIMSASVVCAGAADADALSTAFLIGGPQLAENYCRRHNNVLALLTPEHAADTTWVIGACDNAEVEDV
jgi:FAD:protein FMN transferase